MTIVSEELERDLVSVVTRAGDALLHLWPGRTKQTNELSIQAKVDGSPVSTADYKSNEIILAGLARSCPTDLVLSEESSFNREDLALAERVWVVDPLDGTTAFLQGRDDFSVLIGLCVKRQPLFGLMYFPAMQLFMRADVSIGTTCNGERVRVSESRAIRNRGVYIRNFETFHPEFASPAMDSGLALMKVASGELDGAIIRMTTHREWDIAAPMAAIKGAGGMISNECGDVIECGTGEIRFGYFVASNGIVHQQLLALISQ